MTDVIHMVVWDNDCRMCGGMKFPVVKMKNHDRLWNGGAEMIWELCIPVMSVGRLNGGLKE